MKIKIKQRIDLINKSEVPVGYKKTKVGIIPCEWNIRVLSDISKISTGLTPLRSTVDFFGGNIPWIKTTDLTNGYIDKTEEYLTNIAINKTSIKIISSNSILIAMYGGFNQIGRTGLTLYKATSNQAISSFHIDEKEYNSTFFLNWLNHMRYYWKKFACSSRKDPNITKSDVMQFPIINLQYCEQCKIATILSTWDKAIALQE